MKEIIVINGSGGKGKDSFVEFVSRYLKTENISSVDKIKEAAKILGWSGGKEDNDRLFLSNLKQLSKEYNDYPYEYVANEIVKFLKDNEEVMFIHIREPEEIERIVSDFNAKTLLVRNSNVLDIKTNYSDANVENYDYDFYIENNGNLEDLEYKAKKFAKDLLREGGYKNDKSGWK